MLLIDCDYNIATASTNEQNIVTLAYNYLKSMGSHFIIS